MKKLSTFLLLLLVGVGFNNAFGQDSTPLYAGQRDGGPGNILTAFDTTDWSVISTVTMTSDFGSVEALHGISLDPISEEMYVLYESNGGTSWYRRLGTIDVLTGNITDIGQVGTGLYNDIDFADDGTLYAMGSDWSGGPHDFAEVDPATATAATVYDPPSASWGTSMCYDPFDDRFIRADRAGIYFIDPVAGTSSYLTSSGGETQGMAVLTDNTMVISHSSSRYIVDLTTGANTYSGSWGFNCNALGFGAQPCEDLIVTASGEGGCVGDEYTLTAESLTGGEITWTGGIEDGVPFDPGSPGTYTYTPISDSEGDCPVDGPVTIEVVGLPTVLAGAGDLIFCEDEGITLSSAGDANLYVWNDGEDLDLMPGVGTYTFDLTGYFTEGFCLGENTDEVTVEVVALPTITASASDDPICINMEVTLTGGGGEMYWWDNGVVDGEPYIPGAIGTTTYTVIGTDENGCSNEASVDVEVVDNIEITVASIILETVDDDGEIDIEVSGGAPAYTYDWDNDGTGDFDDTQDLTGLTTGIYSVVVVGAGGCEAELTLIVGRQVGLEDLNSANVAVYPNPTAEFVNVEFEGTFQYELVAINGDILIAGSATDKEVLDLKDFADGVYFINVKNETATNTIKVVKK